MLTWTPDVSQGIALKLQLRSEAGGGPLDALQLRHFTLPTRVFAASAATNATNLGPKLSAINPPPLPASAIAAATRAAVPLPHGVFPEIK